MYLVLLDHTGNQVQKWHVFFLWEEKCMGRWRASFLKQLKKIQNASTKIKKSAVNVQGKHVLYHYKTQNQPSQSAMWMWNLFDYWWPLNAKSLDVPTFLIKKGRSKWSNFFECLILFLWTGFTSYNRDFVNRLQNPNVLRSWRPWTNSSNKSKLHIN